VDEFVSAVARVRDQMLAAADPGVVGVTWVEYLGGERRLAEAEIVAPCVSRLVTTEIRPPQDAQPVGRFSGSRLVPPLGKHIPRVASHEASVRDLVAGGIAYGYLAMVDAEATASAASEVEFEVVLDRQAEDVWPYWVTQMSTARLLKSVVDPKFVRRVRAVCGEDLYHGLLELDLIGWRRRQVPYIGGFYAEAGMLLRFMQTDNYDPGSRSDLLTVTNMWPFDETPAE
jgi:hypothetical protein